jgi:hypothetical protein
VDVQRIPWAVAKPQPSIVRLSGIVCSSLDESGDNQEASLGERF